jgi:DNA-binding NarL/FixJ family response regulator
MVARRLSNVQIASEHTVEIYVSNILRKLWLNARAELCTWVTERTLLSSDTN